MTDPVFEPIRPWGESFLSMRFMAFGPQGQVCPWPRSKWRRAWMRLRGWHFVADSALEAQQKLNRLRTAQMFEVPTTQMSREELDRMYGPR